MPLFAGMISVGGMTADEGTTTQRIGTKGSAQKGGITDARQKHGEETCGEETRSEKSGQEKIT